MSRSNLYSHLCFARAQTFAMVDGHYGTVVDGVFTTADYGSGFAASALVPIASLPVDAVVDITVTGKSLCFALSIASTNTLNSYVFNYKDNHQTSFHYSSLTGRVNSDDDGTNGTFAVHCGTSGAAPFTAVVTLRGADRSVTFAVNGVQQSGVWPLPTTDDFYLLLATFYNSIAVTDVTVTMADLA